MKMTAKKQKVSEKFIEFLREKADIQEYFVPFSGHNLVQVVVKLKPLDSVCKNKQTTMDVGEYKNSDIQRDLINKALEELAQSIILRTETIHSLSSLLTELDEAIKNNPEAIKAFDNDLAARITPEGHENCQYCNDSINTPPGRCCICKKVTCYNDCSWCYTCEDDVCGKCDCKHNTWTEDDFNQKTKNNN